jgi:hypothetical protein
MPERPPVDLGFTPRSGQTCSQDLDAELPELLLEDHTGPLADAARGRVGHLEREGAAPPVAHPVAVGVPPSQAVEQRRRAGPVKRPAAPDQPTCIKTSQRGRALRSPVGACYLVSVQPVNRYYGGSVAPGTQVALRSRTAAERAA